MRGLLQHLRTALVVCLAVAVQPSLSACADSIHMVYARGQGPGDDYNVLSEIRDQVLKGVPGSTAYAIPYPHALDDHYKAVHDGALQLQAYIKQYHTNCPKSKIGIFGYSLGAVMTMDTLCGTSSLFLNPVAGLDPKYASTVIVSIAYGDETYFPFMPWNVGNCTLGAGLYPRLASITSCAPWSKSIQSYCDYGDDQCCQAFPPTSNIVHHQYFTKYDAAVVAFIKKRLAQTK